MTKTGSFGNLSLEDALEDAPAPAQYRKTIKPISFGSTKAQEGFFKSFLEHHEYLKKIFDRRHWDDASVNNFAATLASLYSTLLVCVYFAFIFTELVTYPKFKEYLEVNGFFIYQFLLSDLYFLFLIYQVHRKRKNDERIHFMENHESHVSLSIRIGAIVFGILTGSSFFMSLIDFFLMDPKAPEPCYEVLRGVNDFLVIFFVILQVIVIFTLPRLNIHSHKVINRFGTMHVFATNLILWIRTLTKESLEEITDIGERHLKHLRAGNLHGQHIEYSNFFEKLNTTEFEERMCDDFKSDVLGNSLKIADPYIFPFIVEFSLIGAIVSFIMAKHIGKKPNDHYKIPLNQIRKISAVGFVAKHDFSHSMKGVACGLVVMVAAVANLSLFFGLYIHASQEVAAEYVSKIINTVMNAAGIVAVVIGLAESQLLIFRDPEMKKLSAQTDLDMSLLRFTSIFFFLYMIFTIITGSFHMNIKNFPNSINVINGLISIVQISLQIAFIYDLKQKNHKTIDNSHKPGRQVTAFLSLYNIAQWLVMSFEIQKVRANIVEAAFYGFMPWIIIQRVTLPLAIFFHFHSAVCCIELFKEVFSSHEAGQTEIHSVATINDHLSSLNQAASFTPNYTN